MQRRCGSLSRNVSESCVFFSKIFVEIERNYFRQVASPRCLGSLAGVNSSVSVNRFWVPNFELRWTTKVQLSSGRYRCVWVAPSDGLNFGVNSYELQYFTEEHHLCTYAGRYALCPEKDNIM